MVIASTIHGIPDRGTEILVRLTRHLTKLELTASNST